MPQLNKGGKFVFGKSIIRDDLSVRFPPQAIREYKIARESRLYLITGSTATGGFCVTHRELLASSKISNILRDIPVLDQYTILQGEFVPYKGRAYCWLKISDQGSIRLTPAMMERLDLTIGTELLSIRSSDIAFTMGSKGPLLDAARVYKGIIELY